MVIIQCDSGHSNGDLIACAKNRIYDVRSEKERDTHVVFVIHLPHQAANSSFVGFQGDPWISVHIDDLQPTSDSTITPYEAMSMPISQLFLGNIKLNEQFGLPMDQESAGDANNNEESDTEVDNKPSCKEDEQEDTQILPHVLKDEEKSINANNKEDSDTEMNSKPSRKDDDQESTQIFPHQMEDGQGSIDENNVLPPNKENGEQISESSGPERGKMKKEAAVYAEESQPNLLPPQCQRLHGCIQAAVCRLQDDNKRRATQRVEILVNLIPRDIQCPLGKLPVCNDQASHSYSVLLNYY